MTELDLNSSRGIRAPFADTTPLAIRAAVPARIAGKGDRLREWLDLFIKTEQVANVLAKTTFVPKAMQNHPAEVAAAMMRGFELDIDPLDALSHMHVIQGKVGYSAEFMRRRIIEAGHEILFPETTDSRAVIKARRREHAGDESKWQTFVFTEENARKAKIDLGGYPADKLVARASSRMCRRMFPEVLAGASIAEDLIDAVVIEGGDITTLGDLPDEMRPAVTRKPAGTVQRKRQPRATTVTPVPQPAPKPAESDLNELLGDTTEPDPAPAAEEPPTPTGMSDTSRRKWVNRMFALLTEGNATDRDDQLVIIAEFAGRPDDPPEHRDGITDDELKTVVNKLNALSKSEVLVTAVADILDAHAIELAQQAADEPAQETLL